MQRATTDTGLLVVISECRLWEFLTLWNLSQFFKSKSCPVFFFYLYLDLMGCRYLQSLIGSVIDPKTRKNCPPCCIVSSMATFVRISSTNRYVFSFLSLMCSFQERFPSIGKITTNTYQKPISLSMPMSGVVGTSLSIFPKSNCFVL